MRWLSRVSQLQNEGFSIRGGSFHRIDCRWNPRYRQPSTQHFVHLTHMRVCEMHVCGGLEDWPLHRLIKDPLQHSVRTSVPSDSLRNSERPLKKSSCLQSLKMFSVCSLFRLASFLFIKEQTRQCEMVAQLYCGSPWWLEVGVVFIRRHSADLLTVVFSSLCVSSKGHSFTTEAGNYL